MDLPRPAEAASAALAWVASVGVDVEGGRAWAERGELFDDLYAGTAGVLLGCAEAAAAGIDTARVAPQPYTDVISGAAGILLVLLADRGHDGASHAIADRLVAAAEPTDAGLRWRMTADHPGIMSGFSHGTAGVGYALAMAGREVGRADLIEIAERGAEELLALGDHAEGWAVPLVIPPQEHRPPVFFGWCHGPTGTVRLFALICDIDPQPRWRHAIDACLQALRDSKLPARLYPGYWDNLGRCCGTAAVGQLLLDRCLATGDRGLVDWARELAADVLARSISQPHGLAWSNTEHTADPPRPPGGARLHARSRRHRGLARPPRRRAGRPRRPHLAGLPHSPVGLIVVGRGHPVEDRAVGRLR